MTEAGLRPAIAVTPPSSYRYDREPDVEGALADGLTARGGVQRALRSVEAEINYLETGVTDSIWYASDSWRSHMPLNPQIMRIEDAAPIRDQMSLDREGMFLADAPTAVKDFLDREAAAKVFIPELEDVVLAVTGATKVVVGRMWVHRHSDRSERFGEEGTTYPGRYAHIDYSDLSGPITARQMLGDDPDADRLMQGRFAIFNLWKAISEPPQDTPLAVCDATTVAAEDLMISHIVLGPPQEDPAKEFRLQTNLVQHNPDHRWVYFSGMNRDQLLMFRGYDSDPARFRRAPHAAFDDPSAGPDAPPRESIDIRCVAFFD